MESQSNDKQLLVDQLLKLIIAKSDNDHKDYPMFIKDLLERRDIKELNRLLKVWNERKRS